MRGGYINTGVLFYRDDIRRGGSLVKRAYTAGYRVYSSSTRVVREVYINLLISLSLLSLFIV